MKKKNSTKLKKQGASRKFTSKNGKTTQSSGLKAHTFTEPVIQSLKPKSTFVAPSNKENKSK